MMVYGCTVAGVSLGMGHTRAWRGVDVVCLAWWSQCDLLCACVTDSCDASVVLAASFTHCTASYTRQDLVLTVLVRCFWQGFSFIDQGGVWCGV